MDITVTAEELLTAIRREFPREYEIAVLRHVNDIQRRRIAELTAVPWRDANQAGEGSDGAVDR